MELIVYDCLLLSDMAYVGEVELIKSTLKGRGHRFSNILVSDDLDHDKQGHYVIADVESGLENKTTYLAIRGSFIPSDWAANASFWPSFQDMGIVHAGWYSRMSHLPWSFLRDRLLDGHNVVITGHSLGGAVAQLLTMKLLDSMNLNSNKTEMWEKVQCVTFGAPVCGERSSCRSYESRDHEAKILAFYSFRRCGAKDLDLDTECSGCSD